MKVKILEKKDDNVTFLIDGIEAAFANTIRRIVLSEVPSMAIDEIVILENSSVINDENLALRLGLIPLITDLDSYNLLEDCSCQSEFGCNLCRNVLILDMEIKNGVRTVYSGDLIPEDPNIRPVSEKIPIVKLATNQKIRLEAYARLGKGLNHAKWQPVSCCNYRHVPIVKVNSEICNNCGNCVKVCPQNVFEMQNNQLLVVQESNCILCRDCITACAEDPPAIMIDANKNAFIFYLESTGSLPVEKIIFEAVKICREKVLELLKLVEDKKNDT